MRRLLPRRAGLSVLTASVVAVAGASAAFAYYTADGTGHASASTGSLQPVTVTALAGGDAPASLLVPGGPAAQVVLRVDNPNSFAVTLVSVTGGPGAVTASGGLGTCTTTGVVFADQSGLAVPVGASGTTLVRLPRAASMTSASDNGCQGATFSIPVTITVHQG